MLGERYWRGKGTARNGHTALVKLTQAAMLGSEHACYVLAWIYHGGNCNVGKDSTQVRYWVAKMRDAAGNHKFDCNETFRAEAASWVAE